MKTIKTPSRTQAPAQPVSSSNSSAGVGISAGCQGEAGFVGPDSGSINADGSPSNCEVAFSSPRCRRILSPEDSGAGWRKQVSGMVNRGRYSAKRLRQCAMKHSPRAIAGAVRSSVVDSHRNNILESLSKMGRARYCAGCDGFQKREPLADAEDHHRGAFWVLTRSDPSVKTESSSCTGRRTRPKRVHNPFSCWLLLTPGRHSKL